MNSREMTWNETREQKDRLNQHEQQQLNWLFGFIEWYFAYWDSPSSIHLSQLKELISIIYSEKYRQEIINRKNKDWLKRSASISKFLIRTLKTALIEDDNFRIRLYSSIKSLWLKESITITDQYAEQIVQSYINWSYSHLLWNKDRSRPIDSVQIVKQPIMSLFARKPIEIELPDLRWTITTTVSQYSSYS